MKIQSCSLLFQKKTLMATPFFVSKCIRTKKNNMVYLGMQTMVPEVESYRTSVQLLCMGGNKCLGGCFGTISQLWTAVNEPGGMVKFFKMHPGARNMWGDIETKQFQLFCTQLQTQDFSLSSNKRRQWIDIFNASSGMNVHSQSHIVYASKRPLTTPFFPGPTVNHGSFFTAFCEQYADLVMCVGVTVYDSYVENRGGVRTPLSVVANDYRSIAMDLHRFTCECVKNQWSCIDRFRVRPMQNMAHILFDSLPIEHILINGKHALAYNGDFCSEETFDIPLDVMLQ
jgi:hypothetical protein